MKIPELVYEIRNLARDEEDLVKKDLLFQSAKSLEILGNLSKIADLIVAEYKSNKNNEEEKEKYDISETSLQMLEEHLSSLIHYKFLNKNDRWPYGNIEITKFVPKYLKNQIVKDSNIE